MFRNLCLCGLSQFSSRWINRFVNTDFVVSWVFSSETSVRFYSKCLCDIKDELWSSGFGRVCGYICCINILKVLKMSWCFHCLRIPFNYILSNLILDLYFSSCKQCFPLTCRPICPIHYGRSRNRNFTIYWFPTT